MLLRLSVILLALAVPTAFLGENSQTLRQQYGQPVSETFLVTPGIVVTAAYGKSGNTCELVITPKQPAGLIKSVSDTIDYKLLNKIEEELVPARSRGKYRMGGFVNLVCLPRNDCVGTEEDWQNVVIYTNSGKDGANYDVIRWTRDECGAKVGFDAP
jgi:hypothetical protein